MASRRLILLIDHQDYWRERSARALAEKGFDVVPIGEYDLARKAVAELEPDLVILGCARIGAEEFSLIQAVIERRQHLLVLSTRLPRARMRELFVAGADDVTEKPYSQEGLLAMVDATLDTISSRDAYRLAH